jgi:large subunit ribosomal protein L9
MKVILIKDVPNLGDEGHVVTVKNGYGRNFLIPQGLARLATPSAVKAHNEFLRQASRKIAMRKYELSGLGKELDMVEVVVEAKVGEEKRIFGTVTPTQVAVQLAKQGFEIDRRLIEINEEIKMIGIYSATVRLSSEAIAQVRVRVEPTTEETEA